METITADKLEQFESRDRARLINSLTGYKSANLIGTIGEDGVTNLCIVSSAFHLGANPALIGFIIRPDSVPRDTLQNLRSMKLCTLNHVNSKIYEQAHQTSARYPNEVSEFEECSLTEEYLNDFKAPFVKESNIKISLKVIREELIPENGTHLIITQIQDIHLPKESLSKDGSVDINQADTVCVSGLDTYYTTEKLSRLSYAKPSKPLTKL
jgi:flavin reductase (DIM6/NTAB) family NADH-FMN oxidoreductase RutF